MISTLRDVTKRQDQADELRMARDAAELAQAKAENASRAKSEFMGLVSHEIRTPLTTIKGFTDLLAHTTGLSTDQVRYLALVGAATDSLIGTVDDVLDYARAGQGDLRLDRVPLDFPALVRGAADLVRPMAEARGVAIDVTVTCEGSRHVLGDERRLRQILLNLLQDAIGTLRRGSVALALQGPRGGEPVERWRVSVTAQADEDPEQAASRTVALDGSGLGFIIAQRLVGLMGGGRIDRSTPQGETAAYRLSLSLAPAPVLTDAAPVPARPRPGRAASSWWRTTRSTGRSSRRCCIVWATASTWSPTERRASAQSRPAPTTSSSWMCRCPEWTGPRPSGASAPCSTRRAGCRSWP